MHAIRDLKIDQIDEILTLATDLQANSLSNFKNHLVALLFLERSTRTRCSFELAVQNLGARIIVLEESSSSIGKGESTLDTCKTLVALGASAIVLRTPEDGAVRGASDCGVPIISAGEGIKSHPTQGLLDAKTLLDYFNGSVKGLNVGIVGDIYHSRVAKSDIEVLTALGANVVLIGPETLAPKSLEDHALVEGASGKVIVERSLDNALLNLDAIIMLRVQFERDASIQDDYVELYQLNEDRFLKLPRNAPVLHPGPVNRGIEISSQLVEDNSINLISNQVENGIPTRMALLYLLGINKSN